MNLFAKEKPPLRTNLFLEVRQGGILKKLELPFRLLVLGDFSLRESGTRLEERERLNVNGENFQAVMQSQQLALTLTVPNRLGEGETTLQLHLRFDDLNSFHPAAIVRQIPQLSRYLQTPEVLNAQLDEILHHSEVQRLEAAWRGLKFLVDRTDFSRNVRIEIMDVSREALRESLAAAPSIERSALYWLLYTTAFDQLGSAPYAAVIGNYEFDNSEPDVALLQNIAQVGAACACPFISAVGSRFFGKATMAEWRRVQNKTKYLATAAYSAWQKFRESEAARYIGLTFPRFMLRLPYGPDTMPVKEFHYHEKVTSATPERYLWGNSSFAFATNLVRAFINDGLCTQICGLKSGGQVEGLPCHIHEEGQGKHLQGPVEIGLNDTMEFECANLGFISFNDNYDMGSLADTMAVFVSAPSVQKPAEYDSREATANSRINARLPYLFFVARIFHYLKVLQRENIGSIKDRVRIEQELNRWLASLVTEMKDPQPELIAKRPLRAAQVRVDEIQENSDFYAVTLLIMPHFNIEGMDITLALVGKLPRAS